MSRTSWILFGGALLAAIGTFLPWEEVSTSFGVGQTQSPSSSGGGAVFLLLGLVALAVWAAWPTREATMSGRRLLGLALVVAAMTFFVIAKFNAISSDQATLDAGSSGGSGDLLGGFDVDVSATAAPGLGLLLWTTGVVALWVGTFRAWRGRSA